MAQKLKLSAFVITFNRASLLESCLRAVSFADELIVVDKSSTDHSAEVAARYADRVELVPWSPTVEDTRAYAASLCRHEWILCLDDDEILSPETGPWLQRNLANVNADILAIPLRHYILGVHDERAYYWPEEHYRLFRKGAVEFVPIVHSGAALQSARRTSIPVDSGVCIHHLSYTDVADWIARSNRYTSIPNRVRAEVDTGHLIRLAHERIDYWMTRTDDPSGNDYPAAVALLRAIYDMVDRLKAWETERGVNGAEMFRIAQQTLVPAVGGREHHLAPRNGNHNTGNHDTGNHDSGEPPHDDGVRTSNDHRQQELQSARVQLRATEAELRERTAAARACALDLGSARHELDETKAALAAMDHALDGSRGALRDTERQVGVLSGDLADAQRELALVGNSARRFLRQYLPKLRRHLGRRLLRVRPTSPG